MVFGWGKKKNEKQEIETALLEKEISLSDIPKLIEDSKILRQKTLISEINSFRKKINPTLNQLFKIAKELEKDNLKVDDVDKHLRALIVRGKKQVISTIKSDTDKKFEEIKSLDEAISFSKEITQILKRIGDVLGRQSRVIHIFAKKYADKLKAILSMLNSDNDEISTILNNYSKINESSAQINQLIEDIKKSKNDISNSEERIQQYHNELESLDEKISVTKNEIQDLEDSSEYAKYSEIKEKISSLSTQKHSIKNEIDTQFTKISRPLGKYQHVSSLDKPQKILLEKLSERPADYLTSDNKHDIIVILQAVRKAIQAGSISVKDEDKAVLYLDETTEMLDSFIKKVDSFNQQKQEYENELSVFDIQTFEQKKSQLIKFENDKTDINTRISSFENDISDTKKRLPSLISQIEDNLREITSSKYSIAD